MGNLIVIHTYIRLYINNLKQIKMDEKEILWLIIIGAVVVITIATIFITYIVKRMIAQLEPDAQLKPVKTVLIEGEYLDILTEPELIPDTT